MSKLFLGWVYHLSDDHNGNARLMRKLDDGTFETLKTYEYNTPRELELIRKLLEAWLLLSKIGEMAHERLLDTKSGSLYTTLDEIYDMTKDAESME